MWTAASGTCTLPVRAGFRVTFTSTREAADLPLTAAASIAVQPEGAGFLEQWVLALRRREGADDQMLAKVTEEVFGEIVPV